MLRCLINNLQLMTTNEHAYNDRPSAQAESASFDECIQWLSVIEASVSQCVAEHLMNYASDIEGQHNAGGLASLTASTYGTREFHYDQDVEIFVGNLRKIADNIAIGGSA